MPLMHANRPNAGKIRGDAFFKRMFRVANNVPGHGVANRFKPRK